VNSVRTFFFVCVAMIAGCATAPRSTRLTLDDLNAAHEKVVASLAASDFLRDRRPDSPQAVIVINKVLNLTTDIIPPGEQWMHVARLQGAMPLAELALRKNVVFVLPPERVRSLRDVGFDVSNEKALKPTHVMSAEFRSIRRDKREAKQEGQVTGITDYYDLEYTIVNLNTRQIEWTDRFEFQRQALGLRID